MGTKIVQNLTFERLEASSVPQGGPRGPSDLILDTFGIILEALGHNFGSFFGHFGGAWARIPQPPLVLHNFGSFFGGPDAGSFFGRTTCQARWRYGRLRPLDKSGLHQGYVRGISVV